MKKYGLLFMVVLLLCGCTKKPSKTVEKEGVGRYTDASGDVTTAKVEFANKRIRDVDLDEIAKGEVQSKKELKNGYGMKQASAIKKEWYQQVDFFEEYVEKHGIKGITLTSDGKAKNQDVTSGCTIAVDGFIKAIQQAEKNAK